MASQLEQQGGIALPEFPHGVTAHLVALQADATIGGIVGIRLSVGGMSESDDAPHASRQGPGGAAGEIDHRLAPYHAVGRHRQHGNVAIVVPPGVYLWLWQVEPDGTSAGDEGVGPHQFLHRVFGSHRRIGTRRPARTVVGAKREAQPLAFADGMSHELSPVVAAYGVGRVAYLALQWSANLELLHTAQSGPAVGLEVGGDTLARDHPVHPLPDDERSGFRWRIGEQRVGHIVAQGRLHGEQRQKE